MANKTIREQLVTSISNDVWSKTNARVSHNELDGIVRLVLDALRERGIVD